jgi:hypothetical protein
MHERLTELLSRATDPSEANGQQRAVLELVLLLELKNYPAARDDPMYQHELSEELRGMPLTDTDQCELAEVLAEAVLGASDERVRVGLLSALQRLPSRHGLAVALSLLRGRGSSTWSDEEVWQTLVAIERMLDILFEPPTHPQWADVPELARQMRDDDPRPMLDRLIAARGDRVADVAAHVRAELDELIARKWEDRV